MNRKWTRPFFEKATTSIVGFRSWIFFQQKPPPAPGVVASSSTSWIGASNPDVATGSWCTGAKISPKMVAVYRCFWGVKIILFDGEKNPVRCVNHSLLPMYIDLQKWSFIFFTIFSRINNRWFWINLRGIDHCRVFLGLDEKCRRKLFEQKVSSFISRLKAPIFVMREDGWRRSFRRG